VSKPLRVLFFWSLALLSLVSCDKDADEKEEVSEDSSPVESDLVLETFPSDQESPVTNPNKIGSPAWFRLVLPQSSAELRYRDESALTTVLVFDAAGQWINTDRDVVIEVAPQGTGIKVLQAATNEPLSSLTISQGSPSAGIKLVGLSPGLTSVRFNSVGLGVSGDVQFRVTVPAPTTATNQVNPLPGPEVCAKTTFLFDGFFSLTESTVVALSPAGCAFYADAGCVTQVSSLSVAADSNVSQEIWYKSSGNAFVDMTEGRSGFAARSTCFAI
jgi:hypothetical protein